MVGVYERGLVRKMLPNSVGCTTGHDGGRLSTLRLPDGHKNATSKYRSATQ